MLGADFGRLRELAELVAPHSGYLHMDVMDGHFVPNLTMGPDTVASLRGIAPLDVHLMVTDPLNFVESFADAGADIITVHAEANDTAAAIDAIHARGMKAAGGESPRDALPGGVAQQLSDGRYLCRRVCREDALLLLDLRRRWRENRAWSISGNPGIGTDSHWAGHRVRLLNGPRCAGGT